MKTFAQIFFARRWNYSRRHARKQQKQDAMERTLRRRGCGTDLIASSETQGQSVGSGEKEGRKFSSTGERATGYRLSPSDFQKFKQMPAPDWAKNCFVLLCSIGERFLLSLFVSLYTTAFVSITACLAHAPRADKGWAMKRARPSKKV